MLLTFVIKGPFPCQKYIYWTMKFHDIQQMTALCLFLANHACACARTHTHTHTRTHTHTHCLTTQEVQRSCSRWPNFKEQTDRSGFMWCYRQMSAMVNSSSTPVATATVRGDSSLWSAYIKNAITGIRAWFSCSKDTHIRQITFCISCPPPHTFERISYNGTICLGESTETCLICPWEEHVTGSC